MSTWCAAKNLFLYYRKYVSEHICNKLLWEHIPGILFTERIQVCSRLDGGLWSITSHPCLLPTFPDTHSLGKSVQPDLPAFARSLYIQLWIFLLPLWFCLKGTVISSTPFSPLLSPCSTQAKVTLFAKPNLAPGERIWGKRLPCFPWPPPLLLGAPHAGSIRRAPRVANGFPAAEIIPAEPMATQCLGETAVPDRYHLLSSDRMSAVLFVYLSEW